jgi:hypothetical protein
MEDFIKKVNLAAAPSQIPSRSGSPSFRGPSRSGSPTLSQMQGQAQGQTQEKRIGNMIGLELPRWEIKDNLYRLFLETKEFRDLKGVTYVALETTKK